MTNEEYSYVTKTTYTVFPQVYETWKWKHFWKSKDPNTIFSEDFRIASVTFILKAETVEKHFKKYIYTNKQYYIIMYILGTSNKILNRYNILKKLGCWTVVVWYSFSIWITISFWKHACKYFPSAMINFCGCHSLMWES